MWKVILFACYGGMEIHIWVDISNFHLTQLQRALEASEGFFPHAG